MVNVLRKDWLIKKVKVVSNGVVEKDFVIFEMLI